MSNNKELKIALVHDTYTYFGGAERVLLKLIEMFPDADIYTSIASNRALKKLRAVSNGIVYSSSLSKFGFARKHPEIFKPYILLYWQMLNLNSYDVVISSSHSFCSNWVNVQKLHISYIHTPPRYLYGLFNETRFLTFFPLKQLLSLLFRFIRYVDFQKVSRIPYLIANSQNVKNRIRKFYGRDAVVVYPPIETTPEPRQKLPGGYYLFFSRLVKQKGIRLAIEAFNKNGKKLVVIGTGKEYMWSKKHANKNISLSGFVSAKKLPKVISGAKALIYCSVDEDFGMIPVEVMSYGIPVIAYKSGGVLETIIENKTGIFFNKYNENSLNAAIEKFENLILNKKDSIVQSKKFDASVFRRKIMQIVVEKIQK